MSPRVVIPTDKQASLCDILDGILDTGVVVAGEIVISVADVDLLYLDLRCLLSSVRTAFGEKNHEHSRKD